VPMCLCAHTYTCVPTCVFYKWLTEVRLLLCVLHTPRFHFLCVLTEVRSFVGTCHIAL
jgi:hypothetical protein